MDRDRRGAAAETGATEGFVRDAVGEVRGSFRSTEIEALGAATQILFAFD